MRLFVLRENAKRYRRLLRRELPDADRKTIRRLLAETERQLAEIKGGLLGRSIPIDLNARKTFQGSLDKFMKRHDAQFGALHHREIAMDALLLMTARNVSPAFHERFSVVLPGDGSSCGHCLRTGTSAYIADVRDDATFETYRDIAEAMGFRAMQSTPLCDGAGNLFAVITTLFAEPHQFRVTERTTLEREASKLAPTFDRLFKDPPALDS